MLALLLAACTGEGQSKPESSPPSGTDAPADVGVPNAADVVGPATGSPSVAADAGIAPPLPPTGELTDEELADFEAGLPPIRTGPMATQTSPAYADAELAGERQMQLSLPTANHPMWDLLRRTRVWIDEATQMFRASHPPEVRRLAGTRMTIRGDMLPLESDMRTTHFLISPYTPVCFFHPPAEPNEVVEVRLSRPIEAGYTS